MNDFKVPEGYQPLFRDVRERQRAIYRVKSTFERALAEELNLEKIAAPLFVQSSTGINDDLNGTEKPVTFTVKSNPHEHLEIVQSLAKWKRMALACLGYKLGEGIYTNMKAIRPDEILTDIHSHYVDQWDWEKIIIENERSLPFLENIVAKIFNAMKKTEKNLFQTYTQMQPTLPDTIFFIHTEELEQKYPELTPRERENRITKEYGAVFLQGIGGTLKNGKPHESRAPDYDDWTTPTIRGPGLNGDILVWYPILNIALELSSMGIRVDKETLLSQLEITGNNSRKDLEYHKRLLAGELPLTIGGGIGKSRLCMFYLRAAHIGEVQSSIWPEEIKQEAITRGLQFI